jgi:hypothetical protein
MKKLSVLLPCIVMAGTLMAQNCSESLSKKMSEVQKSDLPCLVQKLAASIKFPMENSAFESNVKLLTVDPDGTHLVFNYRNQDIYGFDKATLEKFRVISTKSTAEIVCQNVMIKSLLSLGMTIDNRYVNKDNDIILVAPLTISDCNGAVKDGGVVENTSQTRPPLDNGQE